MTTRTSSATLHGALDVNKQPDYQVEKFSANSSHTMAMVSAADIAWLVAHLQAATAASPAAWAGRGMTLL